jgi:hypothetical protein
MAYDLFRNKIVMYGGVNWDMVSGYYDARHPSAVVWEWDGVNWTFKITQTKPGPRILGAVMTYDPVNKKVLMFR